MSYTKLFSSIVTSTIWTEDDQTRIVWITMLALSDKNGEVQASIPGLAQVAGVSVESCETAINKFLSADKYSRTPDDDGRRIEKIEGGWALLNHEKYREMERDDDRRDKAAERKRRQRERLERNEQPPKALPPPATSPQEPTIIKGTPIAEDPPLLLPPPADDWGDNMPTETARDYAALEKRINSLHPAWIRRPHLSRIEREELMANAKIFFDLMERDWELLKCYMAAKINPEWEIKPKPWQPDQRGALVKSVTDILSHADRWARECKKRNVPTGIKGGEA